MGAIQEKPAMNYKTAAYLTRYDIERCISDNCDATLRQSSNGDYCTFDEAEIIIDELIAYIEDLERRIENAKNELEV